MARWACQNCGDAYISEPPDSGLCATCQQQHDNETRTTTPQGGDRS
jgi:rubredoxin